MRPTTRYLSLAATVLLFTTATAAFARGGPGGGGWGGGGGAGRGAGMNCPWGGDQIMGTVTRVDSARHTVQVDSGGKTLTVAVSADTVLKAGPEKVALNDLKTGQVILACGTLTNGRLNAVMVNVRFRGQGGPGMGMGPRMGGPGPGAGAGWSCPWGGDQLDGRITAINVSARSLTIQTNGKTVKVFEGPNTLVKMGPQNSSFRDLKVGQEVRVCGELANGTLKAALINVRYRGAAQPGRAAW